MQIVRGGLVATVTLLLDISASRRQRMTAGSCRAGADVSDSRPVSLPDSFARSALQPTLALRFPKGLLLVLDLRRARRCSKSQCLTPGAPSGACRGIQVTAENTGQRRKRCGRVVSVRCLSAITPSARASSRWKVRLCRHEAYSEECARLGIEVDSTMISRVPVLRLRGRIVP